MTWTQQPENDPRPPVEAPGVVAGVTVCHSHASTAHGMRSAHGSVEGWERRVRQIASQCRQCLDAAKELGND